MDELPEGLTLHVETEPAHADIVALGKGLTAHALPATREAGFHPLAVFVRDADGALVAGVAAYTNWNWLEVDLFWISDELRHAGLGSKMLAEIERLGVERGCTQAHLDTFSFQARPFYERHGYELFATLEDYPPGQQRFFLRKRLVD